MAAIHPRKDDTLSAVLQDIDSVVLQPGNDESHVAKLTAARESITGVLRDFLAAMEITGGHFTVIDGFLFLFNAPEFSRWHTLDWWEQRRLILAVKDNPVYIARGQTLLEHSGLASYLDYSDAMVAKSTDRQVKCAWMRKRLVLQECFWNVLDSIAHAAYFQKKYLDMYPALCVLLCSIIDRDNIPREVVLGIDNGAGFLYKKKSRESGLFRFCYTFCKFFFRKGVFFIGGLKLGLLETEGELSCHGAGAVVYQGCDWNPPGPLPRPVSGTIAPPPG